MVPFCSPLVETWPSLAVRIFGARAAAAECSAILSIPAAKRANFVRRVALFCLEGTFFDETVAFIEAKSHHFVRDAREREGKSNEGDCSSSRPSTASSEDV